MLRPNQSARLTRDRRGALRFCVWPLWGSSGYARSTRIWWSIPSSLQRFFQSVERAMERLNAHVTGGGTAPSQQANVGERAIATRLTRSTFAACSRSTIGRGTSGWLHALAPEHCPGRKQPMVASPRAFVVVEEFKRPFPQVHECYVGRSANIERSAIIKRREHARCIHCRASYYLADRHAEHDKFRHNIWEIDNARRLRQDVPIGGQRIGPEALLGCFCHGVPIKVVSDAVAEIKANPASAGRGRVCEQVAFVVEDAVHSRCVHMSDYVSALE